MSAARKRKKVLFVDDEPAFRQMMRQLATQHCADSWEVLTAEGAGQALSMLQNQDVDLVVLDVEMPVVDGVQFLALLNRKYPQIQKVVLTGYANEQYRAECLAGGAELFLEKPRTVDGFEVVFATLNELARWKPETGFRGVLRQVGLQDIIQMECLSRHSTILEVTGSGTRGEIYIQDGEIVHSQIGTQTGEEAFQHIIRLTGGEFNLKPFLAPPTRTMQGQWEFLLMEACRQRDEAAELAANEPAPAVEPANAPGGAEILEEEAPDATASDSHRKAPRIENAPPRPRTRVDEVLICSEQGEVLFEHQCSDANSRINLLEFISQRSRQISQSLLAGPMRRVEFGGTKGKMTVQIQNGCGVMVRVSRL